MVEYSIIIPTLDNIVCLSQCLAKLTQSVDPSLTEIIVIEQGPSDISKGVLQHYCDTAKIEEHTWIDQRGDRGFAHSCNAGLKVAKGQYIMLLNDDVIVSNKFLDGLTNTLHNYTKEYKLGPVGVVGPVSNYVGGRQQVAIPGNIPNPLAVIDSVQQQIVAKGLREFKGKKPWMATGFLSGFCIMFKKQVLDEVGLLDEEHFFNSFEDNDWVTRAQLKGWLSVIAGDVFVYHYGSQVLKRPGFEKGLKLDYRHAWYKKWQDPEPKKLGALYRVKIKDEYILSKFVQSLQKTITFADNIYVLDDNSPIKLGPYMKANYPEVWEKVTKYEKFARSFDERRDRNNLIAWAEADKMDWIFSIDSDEVLEDKVTRELVQKLMHPINPQVMAYYVNWYTFWGDEEHWRFDGVWGQMRGVRLCRMIPGNRVVLGSESSLHNGNVPNFPAECIRETGIRVKHYGYVHADQRAGKRDWYEEIDTDKRPELIGHSDYAHLVDESMLRRYKWKEQSRITIYMPTNKGGNDFDEWVEQNWSFADELLIGDDGVSAEDKEKMVLWGAKLIPIKMGDNFAETRNKLLRECTGEWILQLDIDERIMSQGGIRRMADIEGYDVWSFPIMNYQKGGHIVETDTSRFFRNDGKVEYWGYLHETIDDYVKKNKWKIARSPVKLQHFGYVSNDQKGLFVKMQRYLGINIKQMKDFPNDSRSYFNLAMHMIEDDLTDDAVKLLEIAIHLRPDHLLAAEELGKINLSKSSGWFDYSLSLLQDGEHPTKKYLTQITQALKQMKPNNLVAAKGHCLDYFSKHPDDTKWLEEHLSKMEDVRTKQ